MTTAEQRINVTLRLRADMVEWIDRIAFLRDIPRSQVLREIISAGLSAMEAPAPAVIDKTVLNPVVDFPSPTDKIVTRERARALMTDPPLLGAAFDAPSVQVPDGVFRDDTKVPARVKHPPKHRKMYPASTKCMSCGLSARLDGTFDDDIPCS